MEGHPDTRQFVRVDPPHDPEKYEASELAEKYGLSRGQARTLITIHGSSRLRLDAIMEMKQIKAK